MSDIIFNFKIGSANILSLKTNSVLLTLFEYIKDTNFEGYYNIYTINSQTIKDMILDIEQATKAITKLEKLFYYFQNESGTIKMKIVPNEQQKGIIKFKQYDTKICKIKNNYPIIRVFENMLSQELQPGFSCKVDSNLINQVITKVKELHLIIPQLQQIYNQYNNAKIIELEILQQWYCISKKQGMLIYKNILAFYTSINIKLLPELKTLSENKTAKYNLTEIRTK